MVHETYLQDLMLDEAAPDAGPASPAQEAVSVQSTEEVGRGEHCASPFQEEVAPEHQLPLADEALEPGQAQHSNYKGIVEEVCQQTGDTMENRTDF